jgi:hypothetical protein
MCAGGGALAMLGSGKHVHEVYNDEAKAIVHSAVSAVVRNDGMAVAARSFAQPWRRLAVATNGGDSSRMQRDGRSSERWWL